MNARRLLGFHMAALTLAGVAAFWVYNAKENSPASSKVVLDATSERLSKLTFDNGKRRVEAVRQQGATGWFLTVAEQKDATKYRANNEFEKALDRLLPIRAERVLQSLDPLKQKQYGLDSGRLLKLEIGNQEVSLAVGNETYGGLTNYMYQEPNGPTFLISSAVLRALDANGLRYLDRRIVSLTEKEVDRIVVTYKNTSRTLVHTRGDKAPGGGDTWADPDAPNQPIELYKNWMTKVFRIQVTEYLQDESTPVPVEVMKLEYDSEGKTVDTLEVGSLSASDGKTDYLGRSRFTGGWVRLTRAAVEEAVADLPSAMSATPGASSDQPAAGKKPKP
jgi:hypothetical protein